MKAKEWAEEFQRNPSLSETGYGFALETHKLIQDRSKRSAPKTLPFVIEAVFREQRQKWNAICRLFSRMKESGFDTIMKAAFPEYEEFQNQIKMLK